MGLFPLSILATNERGVVFHLGAMTRVVGPGLVWLVPVVDMLVVLNLDQTLPDWGGLSQIELNRMVRFIIETYSPIPSNLSASQIRDQMDAEMRILHDEETASRTRPPQSISNRASSGSLGLEQGRPQSDPSPWAGASVLWGLATVVASAVAGTYFTQRGFREAGDFLGYLCWFWGFFVWLAVSLRLVKRNNALRARGIPIPPPGWFVRAVTTRSTVSAVISAIVLLALIGGLVALSR
jgi:hypothetical protein